MSRFESPVKVVKVDYICDSCHAGLMRPTGIALMSNPPKYPHRCTDCDAHQNFNVKYPSIEYV